MLQRLFIHRPGDPQRFWSARASLPDSSAVMWFNGAYNVEAGRDQWNAIESRLPSERGAVLDLGCGVGRFSHQLAGRFDSYVGVDLPEMVAAAAGRHPQLAKQFVAATVQQYEFPPRAFDLVLSMACLASACRDDELPAAAAKMVRATRPGGRILMIEPFHRPPALARTCRMGPRQVIELFEKCGAELEFWGGLHFIPARLVLARPMFRRLQRLTKWGYRAGELLCRAAPRLLCDYPIISLRVPARGDENEPQMSRPS